MVCEKTTVELAADPAIVRLVNDGSTDLSGLSVTGSVESDDVSSPIAVELDFGLGFGVAPDGPLLPGGIVRVRLPMPPGVGSATGLVVATATDASGNKVVAHLTVTTSTPTPAIDSWAAVSTMNFKNDGGKIGQPIPLQQDSTCDGFTASSTFVVSGDKAVELTADCSDNEVQLSSADFPHVGVFKGKLTVGSTDVELEVRRTRAPWWPVVAILAGFLLAVWTQGRLVEGSRPQMRSTA